MKLDTDMPIPPPRRRSTTRFPFAAMKPGESFAVPRSDEVALRPAVSRYKTANPGWDYVTRVEGDNVRCWCTSVPKAKGRR